MPVDPLAFLLIVALAALVTVPWVLFFGVLLAAVAAGGAK